MVATPDFSTYVNNLPPQNVDAEEAILGGILLDPGAIDRVCDTLRPEAFYVNSHKEIYKAALALHSQGNVVDIMTVTTWLYDRKLLDKVGGNSKIAQLVNRTVSAVNVDLYAESVLEKYQRRQLIKEANNIIDMAFQGWVSLESLKELIKEKFIGENGALDATSSETDKSFKRYRQMIEAVERIEMTIEDPAFKRWEFRRIAAKFKTDVRTLEDCWHRHLIYTGELKVESWAELKARSGEYMEWLLHGILPKHGLILTHGLGGDGKTRLFYDWAFAIASGQAWNGIFSVTKERRKILFVQTDELPIETISALELLGFDEEFDVKFLSNWNIENIAGLKREAEEFGAEAILIDSLNSVSANSIISENDAEYARPVLALRKLSETLGTLIFLIHHSNKEGDVRGSSAIKAACSMEMRLKRDPQFPKPDSGRRILTIGKTRSRRPAEYSIEFNGETGKWTWLGESSKESGDLDDLPLKQRIVNFLSENRNVCFDCEELHHYLGGTLGSIRRAAGELAGDGIISRKKSAQGNRKLYFLQWEDLQPEETPPQEISDRDRGRSLMITSNDHFQDAHTVSDSAISDRPITKNAPVEPVDYEEISDRSSQINDQDGSKQEPASDTATDPFSDPEAIATDHCRSSSDREAIAADLAPDDVAVNQWVRLNSYQRRMDAGKVVRIIESRNEHGLYLGDGRGSPDYEKGVPFYGTLRRGDFEPLSKLERLQLGLQ